MKKIICHPAELDALPEHTESEIARLLAETGLDALTPCNLPLSLEPPEEDGGVVVALSTAILKFEYGFLKLVRGRDVSSTARPYFIALDFHDYRAAIYDFDLTEAAYGNFERTVRERLAEACPAGTEIQLGRCPVQGNVFAVIETHEGPPNEAGLLQFLVSYFRSSRVLSDLNQAFGEAAIAHAKSTVPSLVFTLAS